jgi:hypothetical protein
MGLKRLRLIDVLDEEGRVLTITEDESVAANELVNGVADAFVVYEVLHNGRNGTSGHKNILRFYTREDLNDDIKRGDIKIEMR